MYDARLILPKSLDGKKRIERKYARVLATIAADILSADQLEYLIKKLEERESRAND